MRVIIETKYTGNLECVAVHGPSGETMTTEAPADNGGQGRHFSPTDLVAVALGTCILTIMGIVAQREKIDLAGATARVEKEMSASAPRRISALTVTLVMPAGLQLTPEQRRKLEAVPNACPVKQSLHPDTVLAVKFA